MERATEAAGAHGRRIAEMAAKQEATYERLSERIHRVADVSSRMGGETRVLSDQAEAAARGQGDLERAIHELGQVSANLRSIARHFAVGE